MVSSGIDTYLKYVYTYILWAYRNSPHESTGEKPSCLLFGYDCKSPTEASLQPPSVHNTAIEVTDYQKELIESLQHASKLRSCHINSEGSNVL